MMAQVKYEGNFHTHVELYYKYMYYSRSGPFDIQIDKCSDSAWLDMVVVLKIA